MSTYDKKWQLQRHWVLQGCMYTIKYGTEYVCTILRVPLVFCHTHRRGTYTPENKTRPARAINPCNSHTARLRRRAWCTYPIKSNSTTTGTSRSKHTRSFSIQYEKNRPVECMYLVYLSYDPTVLIAHTPHSCRILWEQAPLQGHPGRIATAAVYFLFSFCLCTMLLVLRTMRTKVRREIRGGRKAVVSIDRAGIWATRNTSQQHTRPGVATTNDKCHTRARPGLLQKTKMKQNYGSEALQEPSGRVYWPVSCRTHDPWDRKENKKTRCKKREVLVFCENDCDFSFVSLLFSYKSDYIRVLIHSR